MKKFSFAMPTLTLYARSLEEALGQVSSHIATVTRHVASDRKLEDCKPSFTITEVAEPTKDELEAIKPEDHVHFDHALAKHGPIPLDLDPNSFHGQAHAKQIEDRKAEQAIADQNKLKDSRTDAENLAEHSAKEQAGLNS